MSCLLPSMTSYFGRKPFSTSTARSFLGRSLMCPSDAFTTNCLPRYLLIVFAFAGDSTITNAFAISPVYPLEDGSNDYRINHTVVRGGFDAPLPAARLPHFNP